MVGSRVEVDPPPRPDAPSLKRGQSTASVLDELGHIQCIVQRGEGMNGRGSGGAPYQIRLERGCRGTVEGDGANNNG